MGLKTDERIVNFIKRKIKNCKSIVGVLGIEMLVEGGGYDLDTNEDDKSLHASSIFSVLCRIYQNDSLCTFIISK